MSFVNKRRSSRVPSEFLIEWVRDRGAYDVPGEVTDIALHGLFVRIGRLAGVGQLVRLRLHIPDGERPMECFAWVRYCDIVKTGGWGIELFALPQKDRDRWSIYFHKHQSQSRVRIAA